MASSSVGAAAAAAAGRRVDATGGRTGEEGVDAPSAWARRARAAAAAAAGPGAAEQGREVGVVLEGDAHDAVRRGGERERPERGVVARAGQGAMAAALDRAAVEHRAARRPRCPRS